MSENNVVTSPGLLMHDPDVYKDLIKFARICMSSFAADPMAGDNGGLLDASPIKKNLAKFIFDFDNLGNNATLGAREYEMLETLALYYRNPKISDGMLPPLQAFLLAWLRQQEPITELVNAIPALHRQLYYTQFLGLSPKGATPDKVLLQLKPDNNLIQTQLPSGTRFSGGQDTRGNSLYYGLDNPIWLNRGQLSDIVSCVNKTPVTLQKLPDSALQSRNAPLFATKDEGTLFLGFTDLEVNQTLSIYWQLLAPQSPVVNWEYLHGNDWGSLAPSITDETLGFSRSGLWSFTLPPDATLKAFPSELNTLFATQDGTGKHWIRAVFTKNDAAALFQLNGIYMNAMTATLQNPATIDASHFLSPLPAGSVIQSVDSISGLASLQQPLPSFGGVPAETEEAFNFRIGERLHHRQRAITWSDIKSLLKARYPEIQALRNNLSNRTKQKLIVIPVPHARDDSSAPLKPRFNNGRLGEMSDYIKTLSSNRLNLLIENPNYVDVDVTCNITYKKGVSLGWGDNHLRQALSDRFMPWAKPQGTDDISMGKSLNYYDVLAFIESLDHVLSVDDLIMNLKPMDGASSPTTTCFTLNADPEMVYVLLFNIHGKCAS